MRQPKVNVRLPSCLYMPHTLWVCRGGLSGRLCKQSSAVDFEHAEDSSFERLTGNMDHIIMF
jgi:hypothetical protein